MPLFYSHHTHLPESEDATEMIIDDIQEMSNSELHDEHEIAFGMRQIYGAWPNSLEAAYPQNETINRLIQGK